MPLERTGDAMHGHAIGTIPDHDALGRVTEELDSGNVYINRGITGAMAGRHPFGGFKMSGGG